LSLVANNQNTLGPPPRLSADPGAALLAVQRYLQDLYNALILSEQFLPRSATTDFTRAVLNDDSAANARATLGAMPRPAATAYQAFAGGAANVAATLPDSGRWLWFLVHVNAPAGTMAALTAGENDGGSVVAGANVALRYFGVCWRIE
jgi:hypothetical protein